jgi:hypothetical protein
MTVRELKNLVSDKIFTVDFIKKDGTLRTMNCRLKVIKHLKGGKLPYDAESKNLLPVFDMQKGAYRIINVDTIQDIRFNNQILSLTEY